MQCMIDIEKDMTARGEGEGVEVIEKCFEREYNICIFFLDFHFICISKQSFQIQMQISILVLTSICKQGSRVVSHNTMLLKWNDIKYIRLSVCVCVWICMRVCVCVILVFIRIRNMHIQYKIKLQNKNTYTIFLFRPVLFCFDQNAGVGKCL